MISWLKQSTAATLLVGPFLDETDGKTPETGLTLSQADFLLWKQGGTTLAQKNDSTSATHRSNGLYTVPIDDTDTNTLGVLSVSITETGALPVRHDYLVVPANVWDSLVAGTANLSVQTTSNIKINQALANFHFLMTDSVNHAPATGLTVTVTRAIDSGSFASGTLSAVTAVGNGIYRVDFAAADLNGKVITLRATASGADDQLVTIITQPV